MSNHSPANTSQPTTTHKPSVAAVKTTNTGIITALFAFGIWGLFPFYFKQLQAYDSFEIIAHRIVWTFICLLILVLTTRRFTWIKQFKEEPKWIFVTFAGGMIIASNWLIYVWAVNNDHLLEASLGYFTSPLVGICLSLLVLQERLRRLQWISVLLASIAVISQVVMLGTLPWVSLCLALSFSVYGIIQRKTPLMAVDALFIETALILPFVLVWLTQADVASHSLSFWVSHDIFMLMLAGPITLIPLLLYNKSTKMVAYSILSFMNYLTPTFVFIIAVFYYHEPFDSSRLFVFGLIWLGLILFSFDLWQNRPSKLLKQRSTE